jgi:hypothetical protein
MSYELTYHTEFRTQNYHRGHELVRDAQPTSGEEEPTKANYYHTKVAKYAQSMCRFPPK